MILLRALNSHLGQNEFGSYVNASNFTTSNSWENGDNQTSQHAIWTTPRR